MQIYLIVITLLIGLLVYLWREKRRLALLVDGTLIRNGHRHTEIIENASDAIFVVAVARNGKLSFDSLNPAAEQVIDLDGIGFEGKSFDEIIQLTGDAGLRRILQELSIHLTRAIAVGLPVTYESAFHLTSEIIHKSYDISLVPMADDGGISHILCFAQDVTTRKLYKQALMERVKLEEQLSGFAASAPGFFFNFRHGVDGSNAMPFASAGINDLFGLRPEDVADNIAPMNLLIHRDDLQLFIDAIALSAAYISPLRIEFRVEHTDKGELWVESRAMPKVEPDGSVVWHGFMHDITERRRMEDSLHRSSENLTEAQRIGQMGSWELDIESGALTWSNEIYRIFEIYPDVFGASYDAFLNATHPDDRDAVNRAYTASVENHTPYSIDHRLLFADGRIKHVRECCETHYDENGKPRHSHGTVQDITALKVSEQQLKDTQEKLRQLVLSREVIHEAERKHISWEMHEELGQLLVAAKMRISGMRTQLPKDNLALKEDSRAIVNLIDKSIKTIRDLVSDLRPTVLLHGIAPALEWLVTEFNQHPDMICELEINENGTPISEEFSTLVFRVVQESLENIARHAGVLRVLVAWESNQHGHVLTIRHDGYANASDIADNQSLSFFGIQERVKALGGEVRIFSELEHRSVIEVSFPVGGVVAR